MRSYNYYYSLYLKLVQEIQFGYLFNLKKEIINSKLSNKAVFNFDFRQLLTIRNILITYILNVNYITIK